MNYRTASLLILAALTAGFNSAGHAQTLYVTDQQGGVTALNATTFARTGQFDTGGKGPRGIAASQDGTLLLTANQASGDLSVIDRQSGKPIARIPIGPSPEMVRVLGNTAYVTYEPGTDKKGLAHIAVVDIAQRRVTASIPSGHETEGMEFSPDGKDLLVTNEGDNTISVYALPAGTLVHSVKTDSYGDRPRGIKRRPTGGYVVSLEFANKLLILDPDFKITQAVPTAEGPYGLAFSPDGKTLYAAAAKAGLLQAFNATSFAHLRDIKIGKRCWHFTFTPDGKNIALACGRSAAMVVVDPAGPGTATSVGGFTLPWGIIAYPAADGTLADAAP